MSLRRQRSLRLPDLASAILPKHRNRHNAATDEDEEPQKPLSQRRRQRRPPKGSFPSNRDLPAGSFPVLPSNEGDNEENNRNHHNHFKGSTRRTTMPSHSNRTAQYNRHRNKKQINTLSSSPLSAKSSNSHFNRSHHKFCTPVDEGGEGDSSSSLASVTSNSSRRSLFGHHVKVMGACLRRKGSLVYPTGATAAPVVPPEPTTKRPTANSYDWSAIGKSLSGSSSCSFEEDELPLMLEFNMSYNNKNHKYYDELVDYHVDDNHRGPQFHDSDPKPSTNAANHLECDSSI